MKILSINKIIEFRNKSDRGKKNFASNLKLDVEKKATDGGGDYWISSLSAISNSYKYDAPEQINDKIYELENKYENTEDKKIRTMYERNISILYGFEDFDFNSWKPSEKVIFLKKHKSDFLQSIRGIQLKATPQHVFKFKEKNIEYVGAIWFIAKLGGYRKEELGMFSDILFRYLENTYSKDYNIVPRYCIAVDAIETSSVNYEQLQKGNIPSILDKTLKEIKTLM